MTMDEGTIRRIKQAVRGNFDDSPDSYAQLEERYGFFTKLNDILFSRITLPEGALVLDAGCGTGASSVRILRTIPGSQVWGLDNSAAMLEKARATLGESDRLRFVEGDAAKLDEYFDFPFDAVIYSASIFLVPDYMESLQSAKKLLKDGGCVGLTFMDGILTPDGKNALALAEKDANVGLSLKRPVDPMEFHARFASIFKVRTWNEDFMLPDEQLRDFFTVPAMSAGLFPKLPYEERARKVATLFEHMPKGPRFFRWLFMVGENK